MSPPSRESHPGEMRCSPLSARGARHWWAGRIAMGGHCRSVPHTKHCRDERRARLAQPAKRSSIDNCRHPQRPRGSLAKMLSQPTGKLRAELRACNGVCPEAADSIPLYAGNHPVFVVDARTPRILDRHALLPDDTDCEEILHLFHHAPGSVADREQTNPSTSSARLEAGFLGAARPPQPRARRTPPPSFRFASRWTACPSERASGIARRKPLRARLFAAPISSNSAGCAVHSPQK